MMSYYIANMMSIIAPPLKALIVDDDPLACSIISRYLEEDTDITLVHQCNNGADALEAINQFHPDLLFLDVQMPGMSGLELLASLPQGEIPFVIFVTASEEYALQAFGFHALDYLLKPFGKERFKKAIKHAKQKIRQHHESRFFNELTSLLSHERSGAIKENPIEEQYPLRLEIRSARNVSFVDVDSIDWIEAADNYVVLHTSTGAHLIRESMTRLEATLDPQKFVRIHRSRIVNVKRIRELKSKGLGDWIVVLQDNSEMRVGRLQRSKLKKSLKALKS